jgi:hypothetical protein
MNGRVAARACVFFGAHIYRDFVVRASRQRQNRLDLNNGFRCGRVRCQKVYKVEFNSSHRLRKHGGILLTWVYDEIGCPGAILDEFCLRNLSGHTVGWVFGLSVFSLKGDHIGWFEDGTLFDIENKVIGFVSGATGTALELPALAPDPVIPALSKRPCAPTLRGRTARPRGKGWSRHCLSNYLAFGTAAPACRPFVPRRIELVPLITRAQVR